MYRTSLIGLVLVMAMISAGCSSDDAGTTTTAVANTTTTTVAPFDLTAAVDEYLSTIPAGFFAVGDVDVFKDGVEAQVSSLGMHVLETDNVKG